MLNAADNILMAIDRLKADFYIPAREGEKEARRRKPLSSKNLNSETGETRLKFHGVHETSSEHGESHWKRVARISLWIAENNIEINPAVALAQAIYHDSGRKTEGYMEPNANQDNIEHNLYSIDYMHANWKQHLAPNEGEGVKEILSEDLGLDDYGVLSVLKSIEFHNQQISYEQFVSEDKFGIATNSENYLPKFGLKGVSDFSIEDTRVLSLADRLDRWRIGDEPNLAYLPIKDEQEYKFLEQLKWRAKDLLLAAEEDWQTIISDAEKLLEKHIKAKKEKTEFFKNLKSGHSL